MINFRTLDDYLALRRYAVSGAKIAVVGGGFIGSELAASLASNGCKVTMLFPGEAIGAGRYPSALAHFLNAYYRERGVELKPGAKVVDGRIDGDTVEIALSDGTTQHADAVVAGLGVTPNVDLASAGRAQGRQRHRRRRAPAQQRSDIWAAGDVANFHNAALDLRQRVEHESAAVGMGHHAGRAMTGSDEAYTQFPFFYSDLFDLGYEAVGLLDDRLDVVEDWTQPYREGVIYYLDNGRVRGVLLWNVWGQVEAARDLIAEPGPHDADSVEGRLPRMASMYCKWRDFRHCCRASARSVRSRDIQIGKVVKVKRSCLRLRSGPGCLDVRRAGTASQAAVWRVGIRHLPAPTRRRSPVTTSFATPTATGSTRRRSLRTSPAIRCAWR